MERQAIQSELANTLAQQADLQAEGVPPTQYTVFRSATAGSAVFIPGGAPVLAHRSVRLPLGLLLGALLGMGLTYVADATDHRLRTPERASEAFGLPVVAEIPGEAPAWQRPGSHSPPVVDVVVDPLSDAAEAYRKLHIAVRLAPLVLWVRQGNPFGREQWDHQHVPSLPPSVTGTGAPSPPAEGPVAAPAPAAPSGAGLVATETHPTGRRVVLITSPADEPTRSLVVANLAAVLAESGQRVLVATTGGLRTRLELEDRPGLPVSPLGPDPSADAIVANARPSQLPGVSSLALGQVIDNPSKLALMAPGVVRSALKLVDMVLLEAPLLSTQDAEALFPVVDVVVVVAESWLTTAEQAIRSGRLLARHRAPVVGVALTHVSTGPHLPWRRPGGPPGTSGPGAPGAGAPGPGVGSGATGRWPTPGDAGPPPPAGRTVTPTSAPPAQGSPVPFAEEPVPPGGPVPRAGDGAPPRAIVPPRPRTLARPTTTRPAGSDGIEEPLVVGEPLVADEPLVVGEPLVADEVRLEPDVRSEPSVGPETTRELRRRRRRPADEPTTRLPEVANGRSEEGGGSRGA